MISIRIIRAILKLHDFCLVKTKFKIDSFNKL